MVVCGVSNHATSYVLPCGTNVATKGPIIVAWSLRANPLCVAPMMRSIAAIAEGEHSWTKTSAESKNRAVFARTLLMMLVARRDILRPPNRMFTETTIMMAILFV
jgi:hypothetical protein